MLETINVRENDVFIDLGSGVGQVVLQVAASVPLKKCIGIEKADVPDRYALHPPACGTQAASGDPFPPLRGYFDERGKPRTVPSVPKKEVSVP